jgi:hypothetical protein
MPGNIDEVDRDDSTDSSIGGLIGRLGSVSRIQTKQTERLTAISGAFTDPPDTNEENQIRTQTAAIRAAAQTTLDLASAIERKLTPT